MDKTDRKNAVRLGDVLKAGRKFGLEDPSTLELFTQWIQEAQAQVEKSERPVARIKLEITCAELYMELDRMEQAAECFRDALIQAQEEGFRDMTRDLEHALETIERVSTSRYAV